MPEKKGSADQDYVFTKQGVIFSEEMMLKFIRGCPSLLLASLGHSETRQIFEYLGSMFENLVEEEGVEAASQYLLWLASDSPTKMEAAYKKLIVIREDVLNMTYNGIKKVCAAAECN